MTLEMKLNEVMMRLKDNMTTSGVSHTCNKCNDKGFIIRTDGIYDISVKCECQRLKEIRTKISRSGIEDLIKEKTFSNYKAEKDYQRAIKGKAVEYVKSFLKGERYSLALLGQSGIGKTHILSAVAKELLERNISVKHFIADEILQSLQSCKYDEENYNREFGNIVNCRVLLIDDLFKTSVQNYYNKESLNVEDLRQMFKIINYRYNKKLPVLISSEINFQRLSKLDEAIAGRINEMCNFNFIVSVLPDTSKNYRLN